MGSMLFIRLYVVAKRVKLKNIGKALKETLERFKDLGRKKGELAVRGALVHTWGNIIKGTPVDKGGARGAWLIGTSVNKTSGKRSKSKGASYVSESLPRKILGRGRLFLYNNAPYINKLEYGGYTGGGSDKTTSDGFSKLAPVGMVRINLKRWRSTINRIFKRL